MRTRRGTASMVERARLYALAEGTARVGVPLARIAVDKMDMLANFGVDFCLHRLASDGFVQGRPSNWGLLMP